MDRVMNAVTKAAETEAPLLDSDGCSKSRRYNFVSSLELGLSADVDCFFHCIGYQPTSGKFWIVTIFYEWWR